MVAGPLRHLPYLDGLRAVAVLLVLWAHFPFVAGSVISEAVWRTGQALRTGYIGVDLFFVLSGFLITRILLAERRETGRISFKVFYFNRALRIFPIYYLCVAVYALAFTHVPDELLSLLTYTMNFYKPFHPAPVALEHTWSLSVEEQFYLVWPFLIAAIPLRWGKLATGLIIPLVSLGAALLIAASFESALAANIIYMSVVTRTMSLSLGAYLAFGEADGSPMDGWRATLVMGTGVAVLAVDHVGRGLGFVPAGGYYWCAALAGYAMLAYGVIAGLVHGTGIVALLARRLLSLAPLRYIGRISYGLYLYHLLILFLLGRAPYQMEHVGTTFGWVVLALGATFATAHLSFQYLESPLLRLKIRRPAAADASGSARGGGILEHDRA